jgi:anti-anti-sigma factor
MSDGRVLYAQRGCVHVLRFIGDIRHGLTPSIRSFVNTLFTREAVSELLIDVSETQTIDSTNLGELARIARRLQEGAGRRPVVVCGRESISAVLRSMALDEVCDLVPGSAAEDGVDIPLVPALSARELNQLVVSAHRALMDLSSGNQERFHDVVELMQSEVSETSAGDGQTRTH